MANTLVVTEHKYSKVTPGTPNPRTALQVAFWEAMWTVPRQNFKGLNVTDDEGAAIGKLILDKANRTR